MKSGSIFPVSFLAPLRPRGITDTRLRLTALVLFVVLAGVAPAYASPPASHVIRNMDYGLRQTASPEPPDLLPLCPPAYQLQHPLDCADLGPGAYRRQAEAAHLPYPLPTVAVTPIYPYRGLTPHAYGKVITDTAPVFRHPLEALAGLPPARRFEKGFVYVSVLGTVKVDGEAFYQINRSEYMRAADVREARPAGFQGMFFSSPPGSAVGWVITNVQPSASPGAPPDPNTPFAGRYQQIQTYGVQRVGDWDWYLIGTNQWVEQRNLALVQPQPPAGMPPDVIAVNTYEQVLGVYRGGGLVFATLISSGSRAFPTRPGTFKVWAKLLHGRMTGAYFDDRRDYYFLEDVPWILYYDGDRALHGAYWHDNFGIKSSHGCVNLSPRDSRWLYDFAQVGDTVVVFSSAR